MDTSNNTIKILSKEEQKIFETPGWKAINRIGIFVEMHHVFLQNYALLMSFIREVKQVNTSAKDALLYSNEHTIQYVFNFLASVFALRDNCRHMLSFYREKEIGIECDILCKKYFTNDNMDDFIKDLRNYQTHNEVIFAHPIPSKSPQSKWDLVFFVDELLRYPSEWTKKSKKFLSDAGKTINVEELLTTYYKKLVCYYSQLIEKLLIFHKEEIQERNKVAERLGLPLINLPNLCPKKV